MHPLHILIAICLTVCFGVGCASSEVPGDGSDARLGDDTGGEPADIGLEDTDDGSATEDVGDDAVSCEPTTCEALSACGTVDDGCGGSIDCGECAEVAAVHISPGGRHVLQVGETLALGAVATADGGAETFCEFGWSSLDATIARVDAQGTVSGLAPGITEIRAECRGAADRVRVYINDSGLPEALTDADELAVWLRADVGLNFSGGAQVEAWEDLSGNAFELANDNFSRHPRRVSDAAGGHPVLRFTGTHELRTTTSPVGLEEATIFAVVKNNEASHRGQILSNCAEDAASRFGFDGTAAGLYFFGAENGLDETVSLSAQTTEYHLLTVAVSDSQFRVWQNGQEQAAVAVSPQGSWHFGQVGARCSSEYLRGDVAEIMIYRRVLDGSELQDVEAYLTARYGLDR